MNDLITQSPNNNNNTATENNITSQQSPNESNNTNNQIQIEPTLLAILQIEEKYEYIDKIRELKQYIDKIIKLSNRSDTDNENRPQTIEPSKIEYLRKITDIIDETIDILKYLPPENIKLIYSNLLSLIEKILDSQGGV
jgi:ribosomal protein S18